MGYPVQQLRDLLKLAAALRNFAAEASYPGYAHQLLVAAAELEARAQYIAEHRADELPPDAQQNGALHAPVDLRV